MNIIKKYQTIFIALASIIVLNIVGIGLFKKIRLDLTADRVFSLSRVSKNIVGELSDPLIIRAFFSKNLPAGQQLDLVERNLKDLLSEYQANANHNFSYKFYDCTTTKEAESDTVKNNIKTATEYGIYPQNVQTIEKDQAKVVKAYLGLVIQHGDMIEKIEALDNPTGLEYRLTSIFQKMINKVSVLQNLESPINVTLYLPNSFKLAAPFFNIPGVDTLSENIKEEFDKSQERNYGKMQFIEKNDDQDPAINQEAQEHGLSILQIPTFKDLQGRSIPSSKGFAGVVLEHDGKTEVVDLLTTQMVLTGAGIRPSYKIIDLTGFSQRINDLIDNILDINQKISYLRDKGSIDISIGGQGNSLFGGQRSQAGPGETFHKLLSSVYSVDQIEAKRIHPSFKTLIIAGTKEEFSDKDLFRIDQYLMQGRSLIIFHDGLSQEEIENENQNPFGFGANQPRFFYSPNTNGIIRLLAHYGATIKNEYILDENCYQNNRDNFGNLVEAQNIYHLPKIERENINRDLPGFRNIKELFFQFISPVSIDEEDLKQRSIQYTEIARSSASSWTIADLSRGYGAIPDEENLKPYPLGYLLEGNFESYFAETGIPADDSDDKSGRFKSTSKKLEGENTFIKEGKAGKILVIPSSQVLLTAIAENGLTANSMFLMNLIDIASGKSDWAEMRGKQRSFNPLKPYNAKGGFFEKLFTSRTNLKVFNILIVPLLVIIFGLVVFYRRRKHRSFIAKRFS